MPTHLYIILILLLQILPIVQTVLLYLLGIIGMIMIVLSLTSTLRIFNKQQQEQEQEQEAIRSLDNSDLKIPLCNGQYTSINILPVIKNVTSKIDLFTAESPYS